MRIQKAILSAFFVFISLLFVNAQAAFELVILPNNVSTSFRGASVVNDSVAWVSGSNGWVGKTRDGGETWQYLQVSQYETFDFRSIYAFDGMNAIIANAGAPSNILLTNDGGKSWQLVYQLVDDEAFIDGIDFWNDNEGVIYGDPIKGRMLLVRTFDGGKTWSRVSDAQCPQLEVGEASFAASGTGIRCINNDKLIIATGGKQSRLLFTDKNLTAWKNMDTPILQGEATTGIFSFAFSGDQVGVIVGGDYAKDTLKVDHVFYTADAGRTWMEPIAPTRGYRECAEFLNDFIVAAVGPTGIDISYDYGKSWTPFSDEQGFHLVRKARHGDLVILAGGKGRVAVLK
ncbi:MAG TPA: YCF48-related protein [Chryseosolibacter sp.]|nr:YCF48-related protein [Chryseosolibacter sp.]